jgi:hypothetical protein
MTNPRAIRKLAQANNILAQLTTARINPTLNALQESLALLDGYPSTASGADRGGGRSNDETSVTERTAINRIGHTRPGPTSIQDELYDWLKTANHALTKAIDLCDKHTPRTHIPPPRCDGRGLEGYEHWGEPCTRSADKAGLCEAHYKRCYRWRRDHGRPLLRDSA